MANVVINVKIIPPKIEGEDTFLVISGSRKDIDLVLAVIVKGDY